MNKNVIATNYLNGKSKNTFSTLEKNTKSTYVFYNFIGTDEVNNHILHSHHIDEDGFDYDEIHYIEEKDIEEVKNFLKNI